MIRFGVLFLLFGAQSSLFADVNRGLGAMMSNVALIAPSADVKRQENSISVGGNLLFASEQGKSMVGFYAVSGQNEVEEIVGLMYASIAAIEGIDLMHPAVMATMNRLGFSDGSFVEPHEIKTLGTLYQSIAQGQQYLLVATALDNPSEYDDPAGMLGRCEDEWPGDFVMQEDCVQQESDARASLVEWGVDAKHASIPNEVSAGCFTDWPQNYVMMLDCVTQQAAAWERLNK